MLSGFEVTKAGDARVGLVGFPSVGKSTLLSKLTTTESEVAAYEFTTLTAVPGTIHYKVILSWFAYMIIPYSCWLTDHFRVPASSWLIYLELLKGQKMAKVVVNRCFWRPI